MRPSTIAVVGMAGRFPGARNVSLFWRNLRDGVNSIRSLTDAELLAAGVSPEELTSPEYVKRASVLDDVPMFDASFFGFSPRDASIMDPQHRHFLECAWEALEDAGHPPQAFDGSIGVFAGSGMNTYLIHNLLANRRLLESTGLFQLKQTGNDKDVLAIYALILGSAINNDGARKVAPSVEGQAEVIAEALGYAGVSADDVSYVEAHGTGTIVGDPIEVRALTQAFRKSTTRSGYCGIGSVKSNVGHLDAAAGVAGLIKTVLALEHAQLPPSLDFQNLNPHIELKDSPFFVNNKLVEWPTNGSPRRAGVTALGIGGTNAHVVLEEAPPPIVSRQPTPYQLLTVSAKTEAAVEHAWINLASHLRAHAELSLADVAFTCQLGRHAFPYRHAQVVEDTREAVNALASGEHQQFAAGVAARTAPQLVFMFSGQGSQYVNMGRELYENEPVFRDCLNLCA